MTAAAASSANRSLRVRLTASTLAVLAVVLAAFSLFVYIMFRRAIWSAFDDRLLYEARALVGMVEEHRHESYRFEFEEITALPEFDQHKSTGYWEIWSPDGNFLARSRSLLRAPPGLRDLAKAPGEFTAPSISRCVLPDGKPGRFVQASMFGRWMSVSLKTPPATRRQLTVVVARSVADEDATLASLRLLLLGFGAASLVVAAAASALSVSRGLRPAASLADEIGRIDEARLGDRVFVKDLPQELLPPVEKLNQLLARLDESFARERRFTADVSHELRTPLAGLRMLLEVATSRDRTAQEYREVVAEATTIVADMHGLVEDLLLLARLDASQIEVEREPVALREFIGACWKPLQAKAQERKLVFENRVHPEAAMETDSDKLRVVVRNLLANACEYTDAGGRIWVDCHKDGGMVLDVCDSGPPIPEASLPRLFDRFFRVEQARSKAGIHCGIGLSLVRSVSGVLGLAVQASNMKGGAVRFRLADERSPYRGNA